MPVTKGATPQYCIYFISIFFVVLMAALSLWLQQVDWQKNSHIPLGWITVFQYMLMAICMLLAWYYGPKSNLLWDYRWLIIAAVLARLLLLSVEPYSSNDIDRYLFDGKIAISGFDPYRVSHDAPALQELRAIWMPPAEHAKYVTLYPPLALGLFSLASSMGIEWAALVWKLLVTLAGLAILWMMVLVLGRAKKLRHLALIALSPLLILETGVGAHLDVFSALTVCAAIYFWQTKRVYFCGLIIGIGALLKILPLLMLVPLVFFSGKLRVAVRLISATLLTVVSGYALAFLAGFHPIGSIGVFFQKWRNGSPVFNGLDAILSESALAITLPLLAIFAVVLAAIWAWRTSSSDPNSIQYVKILQWTLAIPLILSPVVFPWYLLPLVPLVALSPNTFFLAWFILFPFFYEVLNQFSCCGVWAPAQWPIYVLTIGMVLGLVADRLNVFDSLRVVKNHVEPS